jgi:hypothetical protein
MLVLRENLFGVFDTSMRPLSNHSVTGHRHGDECTALKDTKFSKAYYKFTSVPISQFHRLVT